MAEKRFSRDALTALRFIWNHPANRGRRARKLGEAALFQVRGRLLGRGTTAAIGERSKIVVYPRHGQAGLLYANPTEVPEINVWRRTLRAGDLFIDVGANVGAYTIWAIEAGAEVVAIEPDGWAVEQLAANLALNGYEATVLHAAASSEPGTVTMTTDLGVTNRIVTSTYDGPVERARAVTLDEVLGERTAAGVKVDVEGAEMMVVLGADRALRARRIRLLQCEWTGACEHFGERRENLAAHLRARGYDLFTPSEDGTLSALAHDGPQQPDVFARPRD